MNIGQLDGQPLALQIFNGMTAESICVNERWAKEQLFRCVCFAGGQIKSTPSIAWRTLCFNLRPPCGGRLCTGGALYCVGVTFQSTSSAWRTTHPAALSLGPEPISIHVLRVEDDRALSHARASSSHFNPRPPCGGRLGMLDMPEDELEFQSTSSVWRTTRGQQKARGTAAGFQSTSSVWRTTTSSYQKRPPRLISIHVLRVEDDPHFNA